MRVRCDRGKVRRLSCFVAYVKAAGSYGRWSGCGSGSAGESCVGIRRKVRVRVLRVQCRYVALCIGECVSVLCVLVCMMCRVVCSVCVCGM